MNNSLSNQIQTQFDSQFKGLYDKVKFSACNRIFSLAPFSLIKYSNYIINDLDELLNKIK